MTAARKRAGLTEMRNVVTAEADRIAGIERAREKMGEKPIAENIRRAEVLDDIGDLIATIIPVSRDIAPILRRVTIAPYRRDPDPPSDESGEVNEAQSQE